MGISKKDMKKNKMSSEKSSSQEVAKETMGGCDPFDSGNAPAWSVIGELDGDSISEWRRSLEIEIEKASKVRPSHTKLLQRVQKVAG